MIYFFICAYKALSKGYYDGQLYIPYPMFDPYEAWRDEAPPKV